MKINRHIRSVLATTALLASALALTSEPAKADVICPSAGGTLTAVIPPIRVSGGVTGNVVCVSGGGGVADGARYVGVNTNITKLCVVQIVFGFPARTFGCSYSYPLWVTPLIPRSVYNGGVRPPGRLIATQAFHDGTYTLSQSVYRWP